MDDDEIEREKIEMTIAASHAATSKPQWRQMAYYLCHTCSNEADYIIPRGLFTLCSECKTKYENIVGQDALELKE
jgi:Zn finger protein HypA/HybF involved in hydrogenase expression